jgi:HD-GYP domain-containing protein (c-di-GMP phosphodiesterase class II)
LKEIEFPWPLAQIVLQHHERINGSGCPAGLTAEDIIIEARTLAVADVVEAMASHRPYRPTLGREMALDEISKNKGILYDPDVVDACVKTLKEKDFQFRQYPRGSSGQSAAGGRRREKGSCRICLDQRL